MRRSAAASLLMLLLLGCGADPETPPGAAADTDKEAPSRAAADTDTETPPGAAADAEITPDEGEALVQLVGDRVTLESRGALRLSLLRRLSRLGAFELDESGIPDRPLTLSIEGRPLVEALARLLDGVPHRIETAWDPGLGRQRVVALRAGAAPITGSGDAARRAREDAREARLAALEDARGDERLDRLLEVEPEGRALDVLGDVVRHDPDAKLRAAAVMQLGGAREPGVSETLLGALRDEDGGVVVLAVEALGRRGDPAAIPYLRDLEAHPDLNVRDAAKQAAETLERGGLDRE